MPISGIRINETAVCLQTRARTGRPMMDKFDAVMEQLRIKIEGYTGLPNTDVVRESLLNETLETFVSQFPDVVRDAEELASMKRDLMEILASSLGVADGKALR